MFNPTHRHSDGGLYQYLYPQKGKSNNGPDVWEDGIAYCNDEGMVFWTNDDRWAHRFEPIIDAQESVVTVYSDNTDLIASIKFRIIDAGDYRHLIVSAGHQRNSVVSVDFKDWLARILRAQADIVTQGLHIRDHDFPDLIGDVNAFHAKFGQEYTGKPRILPADLFDFRVKFHNEETTEYRDEQDRLKDAITRCDRRDILNALELQLDALCDAVWVVLGTADLQFGRRAFIEAWRRVYKQNMLKVLATDDPNAQDSGREIKYDIRKPAGWQAPDHRDLVIDNAIFDDIFGKTEDEPAEFNGTAQ